MRVKKALFGTTRAISPYKFKRVIENKDCEYDFIFIEDEAFSLNGGRKAHILGNHYYYAVMTRAGIQYCRVEFIPSVKAQELKNLKKERDRLKKRRTASLVLHRRLVEQVAEADAAIKELE